MSENRKLAYEKIRVCAMFFTIGVHSLEHIPREGTVRSFLYNGLILLFFTCNSMFFMLSGKFALATECKSFEEYCKYYYKKIVGLVLPVLAYMLLRSVYEYFTGSERTGFWRFYIQNVFFRYGEGEYWFLYVLVGLILAAPFLHRMVAGLGKKEMVLLLGIGVLHNSLRTYASYFGLAFPWQNILGEWALYFILGYCLEQIIDTAKAERVVVALAAVSFCISMIQKQYGLVSFIHDLAPTFTLISCAFFLFLRRSRNIVPDGLSRLILKIGKYSFGVYMVHNIVLPFLVDRMPLGGNYLFCLFALMTGTFIVSLLIAIACENTVIRMMKAFPEKVILLYRQHRKGATG